jgi:hypothetical protein
MYSDKIGRGRIKHNGGKIKPVSMMAATASSRMTLASDGTLDNSMN